MLEVRHLDKAFPPNETPALADLNFEVADGEFVSLIGPTGCGKTTVLRIVSGLIEPSAGEVFVDGRPSLGPSTDKAMVFQAFNLFPWRTAAANVAYGLEVRGVRKRERTRIASEYLHMVGLGERLSAYPWQLSGGQNQRVGLARALAVDPKLLLMDEPFGALDALTREQLQGELQRICAERSLTVLFVTHSIDEAIYLSDRILVMGVPGSIIAEYRIKLARPRYDYKWRSTEEYTEVRESIWELLQHRAQVSSAPS